MTGRARPPVGDVRPRVRPQLIGIIVVAIAVLAWSVWILSGPNRGSRSGVTVVLNRADGLRVGASVTYLGVAVGSVERIEIHDRRIIVKLSILTRTDLELRTGDSIRVSTLGLIGDKIIELVPGPRDAPLLGADDSLFVTLPPPVSRDSLVDALLRPKGVP